MGSPSVGEREIYAKLLCRANQQHDLVAIVVGVISGSASAVAETHSVN